MVNPFDAVLERENLKYEDLRPEEKRAYDKAGSSSNPISPEEFLEHVKEMIVSVTLELCDTPDTPDSQDKNSKLKARLKNYTVWQAFLETPIKARKAFEKSIAEGGVKNNAVRY
jgi:hypothetical protein